jgi:hypothetical protein
MAHRGSSKHRPVFHAIVLAIGFVVGIGPLQIKLVILTLAIGPIALDVSLMSLLGVLIAYLIARSLF